MVGGGGGSKKKEKRVKSLDIILICLLTPPCPTYMSPRSPEKEGKLEWVLIFMCTPAHIHTHTLI